MRLEASTSPTDHSVEFSESRVGETGEPDTDQTRTHQGSSRSIGHFTIVDRLGAGQFGNVYRARDNKLDRDVALKVPKEFLDESVRSFFLREARAAAQLNHPNIVGIHEVDESEDSIYLVTEFVQGLDLREWLQIRQPTSRQVAEISSQILQGLHHAHEAGVVHRDLKPANIMMDEDDHPRIMDFGLAKREIGEQPVTVEGEVLGTPAYMSPEQAIGNSYLVDRRADIYSFGVMLFEMLTGEKPFRGDRRVLLIQITNNEPPMLRSLKSNIPVDLETICLKCLEKYPPNRYQTAEEVADEIARYLEGKPIVARPISKVARALRVCARFPIVTTLVISLVISLVVGVAGIATQLVRANREWKRAEDYASEVTKQQKETRRYLYVSTMKNVQQAWDLGMFDEVRRLLDGLLPRDETVEDVRTFEWYYYDRLCRRLTDSDSFDFRDIVTNLEATPDGEQVAVVGEETTLQIWDRDGKSPRQSLKGMPAPVRNLVFSGDGQFLLAETSRNLAVWKKTNGQFQKWEDAKLLDAFKAHFSLDSKWLLAQTGDQHVVTWDLRSPQPKPNVLDFGYSVHAYCILNDNQHLVTVDRNGQLKFWELETGLPVGKPFDLEAKVTNVIQPRNNGQLLFAVLQDDVVRLDLEDLAISRKMSLAAESTNRKPVYYAMANDSGDTILAVNNQTVKIIDTRSGRVKGVWDQPKEFDRWLEIDSRNRLIAGISESKNVVTLWSLDGFRFGQLKVHNNRACALDVTTDGEILSSGRDHVVKFSSTEFAKDHVELGRHTLRGKKAARIWSLAFSANNEFLASGALDGRLKVWNVNKRELEFEMSEHQGSIQYVLFSPDNKILASASRDRTIRLTDTESREVAGILEGHTDYVNCLSYSKDGKRLASVGHDGKLIVWDLDRRIPEFEYQAPDAQTQLWAVQFAPDDEGIYFGGTNCKLQYLSLQGEPEVTWELDLKFRLTSLVFSPDEKILSATASDGIIYFVDHASQNLVDTLTGHSADAMSTAFTPDSKTLVSGCLDGQLRFWNLATGERTVAIPAHLDHLHCVRFSSDGKILASGSWDGNVRLWLR